MADQTDQTQQQGRVVDFRKFYPTPRNTFYYPDKSRRFPAWAPGQLGERDRARIENIHATLSACETAADQTSAIVDAITILSPTAPADELRNEPFEALWGALLSLVGIDNTAEDQGAGEAGEGRPTPAARRKSGSRRITAK